MVAGAAVAELGAVAAGDRASAAGIARPGLARSRSAARFVGLDGGAKRRPPSDRRGAGAGAGIREGAAARRSRDGGAGERIAASGDVVRNGSRQDRARHRRDAAGSGGAEYRAGDRVCAPSAGFTGAARGRDRVCGSGARAGRRSRAAPSARQPARDSRYGRDRECRVAQGGRAPIAGGSRCLGHFHCGQELRQCRENGSAGCGVRRRAGGNEAADAAAGRRGYGGVSVQD